MLEMLGKLFGSTASEAVKGVAETVDMMINRWKASPEQIAQWELEKAKLQDQAAARDEAAMMKLQEIDASDRANARQREATTGDKTPKIIAFAVTGGFFGVLLLLAYVEVPNGTKEVLYVMVGSLGTAWTSIINYYFGSSSGSASKQALIDKMRK